MAALARANDGAAPAYGNDALSERVTGLFSEVFERDVEVWFTATGTASNSLSLAGLSKPGGIVFCAKDAHIQSDESGATEFQSGGMKLIDVTSPLGKMEAGTLAAALDKHPDGGRSVPVALSLTNATEWGTTYAAAEVAELAAIARARGMAVHMDGARFGNAVAATGATPAELTWKSGVDFLSFGGTKNGCWAAEAIVVFTPGILPDLSQRRQRAGHTFSKARFVAAQFEAYLTAGNWLAWARHANTRAEQLRSGLRGNRPARLGWENGANEVFAVLGKDAIARARAAGATLYEWPADGVHVGEHEELVRLVTSWATSEGEVARFLEIVRG
jgi:threonine aldolase